MAKRLEMSELAVARVAEILLGASSAQAAWRAVMGELERAVGFDSGFVATTAGAVGEGRGAILGHDERALRRQLGAYLDQIGAGEIRRYANRARRADEVWSTQRRFQLAARYEPLEPRLARHMLVRVSWRNGSLLGFNLERQRRPFGERALRVVDAMAPLCHLIDSIARRDDTSDRDRTWADAWGLTCREAEVAALVVRGLQNAEVASVFGLSANTVRNTLARVFAKAGASNRAELVFLASAIDCHRDGRSPLPVARPRASDGARFVESVRAFDLPEDVAQRGGGATTASIVCTATGRRS